MIPAIVYTLLFVYWTKEGPHLMPGIYSDKFNCQVAAGEMATAMQHSPSVRGWSIVGEPCAPVAEAKKA